MNFKDEIRMLEELSRSLQEKTKDMTDVDLMGKIQHIKMCIHTAYVSLKSISY